MTDDARWVQRMEDDMRSLKQDTKDGVAALSNQLRAISDQFTALQLSLPPVYVTRSDLRDRLAVVTDECDRRDKSHEETTKRLEASIQRLIFVVIGALITAGLGLLQEVFHLLGRTTP